MEENNRQERQRWKKPHVGVVKGNWDAILDKMEKKMGVRVIATYCEGNVLVTMCTIVPFIIDSTIAEAVAAWKAVEFYRNLGILRLILEDDALEVVHTLWQEVSCWSQYI